MPDPEAVSAFAHALFADDLHPAGKGALPWDEVADDVRTDYEGSARDILAALEAEGYVISRGDVGECARLREAAATFIAWHDEYGPVDAQTDAALDALRDVLASAVQSEDPKQ